MDTDPLLGGRFRLGRLLGRGGMGSVYEAYDARLMRDVAIKRIAAVELDATERERVIREARIVASLSSPHIVQVYDLVGEDDELCIVMERLHGRPLSAVMADDTSEELEFVGLVAQALVGLADAHAAGVIHRDIKPENIFVVDRVPPLAKVLDFGIAKSMSDGATRSGGISGTPAYMAPEQLRGQPLTHRADVFAMGVVLYRYFTGCYPFGELMGAGYLAAVSLGQYRPAHTVCPSLPPLLAGILDRALALEPRDRTESALALREELMTYASSSDAMTVRRASAAMRLPSTTTGGTSNRAPLIASSSSPASGRKQFGSRAALALLGAAAVITVAAAGVSRFHHADATSTSAGTTAEPRAPVAVPSMVVPNASATIPLPVALSANVAAPDARAPVPAVPPRVPVRPPPNTPPTAGASAVPEAPPRL